MSKIHDGQNIPVFDDAWHPSAREKVWIAWDSLLNGATISSSEWILPSGWTNNDTDTSQTVTDDEGTSYTAANAVELSTTKRTGIYRITNKVTLSDGRTLYRSVDIVVKEV